MHAANTGCPTLFAFGAARRNLEAAGYPHVQVRVADGAAHGYMGREEELFETGLSWLSGL